MSTLKRHRKRIAIAVLMTLAITLLLGLRFCAQPETQGAGVEEATQSAVPAAAPHAANDDMAHGERAAEPEKEEDTDDGEVLPPDRDSTSNSSGTQASPASASTYEPASSDSGGGVSTPNAIPGNQTQAPVQETAPTETPKRWVEETEPRWVVDQEAWSEQVPVYVTAEKSICNVCGADVTGNAAAHGKTHMLAGEGSGHHSEVIQMISHYETIHHDEIGHWETVVVGGHWE